MKAPKATIGFGPGRSKIAKAMRGRHSERKEGAAHEKRETKAMERKEHRKKRR